MTDASGRTPELHALLAQASQLHGQGRLDEAERLYLRVLKADKNHADALHFLGVLEAQRGHFTKAAELIGRSVAINPGNALAQYNHGNTLRDLQRNAEALASYDRALAANPRFGAVWSNRGAVLLDLGRAEEALASIDRSLAVQPGDVTALFLRGNAVRALGRSREALAMYDRVLALAPDHVAAQVNRGDLLRGLGRLDEALAGYEHAAAREPRHTGILHRRGAVLRDLGRYDEALTCFERIQEIAPKDIDAYESRSIVLRDLARFEEAIANYDRALKVAPDRPFLFGERLFCRMNICDWRGIENDFAGLEALIEAGKPASAPFPVLTMPLSAAAQKANAEIYARAMCPHEEPSPQFMRGGGHERIRLGYFSSDFHNHAIPFLIADLFERHDRSQFETIAFSIAPPVNDAMHARLEKAFDRFVEAGTLPDGEIVSLARSLKIDIAVDLNGFTKHNRAGIFARRVAPVQVNYLGYPGTMGGDFIDYIIADPTLIPKTQRQHYSETVAYLPHTYQPNDPRRPISDRVLSRRECGLPEKGFVFCCFNNNFKVLPAIFDVWIRLLGAVEGSVLWLLADNASAAKNLRAEAAARGVAGERLVFAQRMGLSEHLARHRLADLFLDTLPYNAHTTASDALWAGLPLITCQGETFAARVAASLLNAVGLPELVTSDFKAYEALALELANDPQKLAGIRRTLAANRSTAPLFDAALFAKHIESAYRTMWERHCAGLAPESFQVPP